MKLEKYHLLKSRLETFKFERSYTTLNKVLYYFSFLGNIFLIYFGYFFVKSITDTIPPLFPFQDTFFIIFVGLFLTGYELTKRFALEQVVTNLIQARKVALSSIFGILVVSLLIAGSFYLSIKGAHRLVDNAETITLSNDSLMQKQVDSVTKYFDKEIAYYREQPGKTRADRLYRDSIVNSLTVKKEEKVKEVENKLVNKVQVKEDVNKENSTAFLFITIFLELLIVIGVGFNAYYTVGTFNETGKLLQTPKFRQLDLNLKLLKLYYQNGKKVVGDPVLSFAKFKSLVDNQKLGCTQRELKDFITLCQELDITKQQRAKKSEIAIPYLQAKELLENQEMI